MEQADHFVDQYISNLTTSPLDLSKPLWEVHIINVKTFDAKAVAVTRIHHSMGDGASLMSLLLAFTRKTSDPDALPTLPATKRKLGDSFSSDGGVFWWFLLTIWSAITLMRNTLVDLVLFIATALVLKDTKTPMKGENRKDEGAKQKGHNNLPKGIRLRAYILVNLRPAIGIQDMADMMAKTKCGNKIGDVLLPFTIALQDDPLDYVRGAKSLMDRKKHSLEAFCTYLCTNLVINLIGAKAVHLHFQSYANKMTICLSVDPDVYPDPEKLLDDLEDSLKLIHDAVVDKGLSICCYTINVH
ncbi:hypothetical protein ACLB2K_045059 [Fragaria x ananassa]